jgi:DNA-binding MarR family transcriptional regulator
MPPIDFNDLDTAVHGPIRLGVMTALYMDGPLDFTTLKKRMKATDGALGQHLLTLEQVGYIGAAKSFVGRRPRTTYRITPAGRRAFLRYIESMRQLLATVEHGAAAGARPPAQAH